ncbi:helix-turn-helix transcriptional regulator [Salinimonas chungwhensis]|uniref:helix-turn-helix transcriptional regulator n=1 Tax=Salinimonas chungwhensis TaxID=265425 RepID=UPI0003756F77|nr:response regulator transcription factor [Salinimonas chungwhensis]
MHNATDDKSTCTSILLVGEYCIQTQFIQRELEKAGYAFTCRSVLQACESAFDFSSFRVILTSYRIAQTSALRERLNHTENPIDIVIYDVPETTTNALLLSLQNLKGMLYEHAPIEHLTCCLEHVVSGDYWLPRKLMAELLSSYQPYAKNTHKKTNVLHNLTKREQQIIERVVQGKSNLEIAEELFVAESTVKTHIYRLYKKLNVSSRKEAISKFGHSSIVYSPKKINNHHNPVTIPVSKRDALER